jgi:hypothetical protein
VLRQSRRHRWRTGPPLLRGARAVGGFRLWEGLAYAGVGQDKMVIDLEQRQLIPQARFALTEGIDPASDRCDPLADVEVEPLDKRRIDAPAPSR